MKKKRILSMILASSLLIGALAACAPAAPAPTEVPTPATAAPAGTPATPAAPVAPEPPPADRGPYGRLILATANETPSVAPGRTNAAAASYKIHMNYDPLFRTNFYDLEPVPHLVSNWQAISDTRFEFTIHQGIMFHNGEELTAYDIIASWEYVRNYPDARAGRESIVEFGMIDRYSIWIDTIEPNALLFSHLTHHGNVIMPKSLIESGHDFTAQPVGSGPFVFDEWRLGDSLHFSAFDNYFNPERAAKVETVTWRIIPEGASRTIALETGEVDYVVYVAFSDIQRLKDHPDIEVLTIPSTGHNNLQLNNEAPQFSNIVVRQALNMAIDREALVMAAFNGFAVPTSAQIPTVFIGATYEGTLPFDPAAASALLAEHGIDPESLAFEIIASNEERRRMGEVVQANLADIGIPVSIVMMDLATTLATTGVGGWYEAAFGGFTAPTLLGQMRGVLFYDPERVNRGRINNPELNELILRAIGTVDAEARIPILEEASRVANEHMGHVPTHLSMIVQAFNANLVVPELSATAYLNLNMIYWR